MVRSHLEYAQTVWSPHKQFNIEQLERVQRRATKIIPGLHKLSYEQRLVRLKLPTLTYRRARGDMIETYKIHKGFYDNDSCPTMPLAVYENTRGHCMKLFKLHAKKDIRKYSFSSRVVDVWNSLPMYVIESANVNAFKTNLDKHWSNQEVLTNFKAKIRLGNRNV
jgi:ribonucleases P/MRP protein subunit RPP40